MNKIESLKKLVEVISPEEVRMSSGLYCNSKGDNCVIAHLLLIANKGVNQGVLSMMDNSHYSDGKNGYSIEKIIKSQIEGKTPDNLVKKSLESLGFDLEEDMNLLQRIQSANDQEGKLAVIQHIEDVIKTLDGVI